MLPTIQFDPSSLAIWTTTEALQGREREAADDVLRSAFTKSSLSATIEDAARNDGQLRTKLQWLGSCVWHEKRHFFDTLLTNYGALRFSLAFQYACNYGPLVAEAVRLESGGEVWFPAEVYGDPVRRRLFEIDLPPANILEIAEAARQWKRLIHRMNEPAEFDGVQLALGAEAQLEGLAQTCQLDAIYQRLGLEARLHTQSMFVERQARKGPYRMMEAVSASLGCFREIGDTTVINPTLAAAIFITALCAPFGLGPDERPAGIELGPGPRMSQLYVALGRHPGSYSMSDDEAWSLVDDAARELWGRTAVEEIEVDVGRMESLPHTNSFSWLDDDLISAWKDFVMLRRQLLSAVRAHGPSALLPRQFAQLWLDRLQPWHIVATPGGRYNPPSTSRTVFGRRFNPPVGLEDKVPRLVEWAYLRVPDSVEDVFAVTAEDSWLAMLEQHAPRALLMQNGRRHRLMVPPQIERPIAELEDLGVTPRFDPMFEFPETRTAADRQRDAAEWARWSGKPLTCVVSGKVIDEGRARLLTPWEFRMSAAGQTYLERSDWIFDIRSGSLVDLGVVTNAGDWADKVVDGDLLDEP